MAESFAGLRQRARSSLLRDLETRPAGPLLSADRWPLGRLRTRDFCFAARGLLQLGEVSLVRALLEWLLCHRRASDGRVPCGLVPVPRLLRAALAAGGWRTAGRRLRPEYVAGRGREQVDCNALVVLRALDHADHTGDCGFLHEHSDALEALLAYYARRMRGDLFSQPPFADWQNSVRRDAPAFYTNLLIFRATERWAERRGDAPRRQLARWRATLERVFRDPHSGLFRTLAGHPQLSLGDQLLALDLGFVPPRSAAGLALYDALRSQPLWSLTGPARSTWPDYPASWISLRARLAGLRHVHDRQLSPWLLALGARVSGLCGDRSGSRDALQRLERRVLQPGGLAESFQGGPVRRRLATWLDRNQQRFSWGAGLWLEALASYDGLGPPQREGMAAPAETLRALQAAACQIGGRSCIMFDIVEWRLGVFAHLQWSLELMQLCEEQGLLPYFHFSAPHLLVPERGSNWFHYFFVHRQFSGDDLESIEQRIRADPSVLMRLDQESFNRLKLRPYNRMLTFARAAELVRKYIRIRPCVRARVESWHAEAIGARRALGVHYRGTDKQLEAPRSSYATVLDHVLVKLAELRAEVLFVATDERGFLLCARERLAGRVEVVQRSRLLSDGGQAALHRQPRLNGYQVVEEALIDCLLLARCEFVVKTPSFLSGWAKIFRPELEMGLVSRPHAEMTWFPDRAIPSLSL